MGIFWIRRDLRVNRSEPPNSPSIWLQLTTSPIWNTVISRWSPSPYLTFRHPERPFGSKWPKYVRVFHFEPISGDQTIHPCWRSHLKCTVYIYNIILTYHTLHLHVHLQLHLHYITLHIYIYTYIYLHIYTYIYICIMCICIYVFENGYTMIHQQPKWPLKGGTWW